MRNRIVPCALALLSACGVQADTPPDSSTGTRPSPSVTLVGDTAFLELPVGRSAENGDFQVSFDAVLEDSRCPTGVQCVSAGNASIRLTLTTGSETAVTVVNSARNPRLAAFSGYTIGFRDLNPYPVSQQPTDRSEYVATIAIVESR